MKLKKITINTDKRNVLVNITNKIKNTITDDMQGEGMLFVFCPHTTAALTINESADPDVSFDIEETLTSLVPEKDNYHHFEGNSDSHIKTVITGQSLSIPFTEGKLILGRWQGIFFCEYDGPRKRDVHLLIIRNTN